jgi:hypothetical protein
MLRNVFCPHKDYSSYLGFKLTVFKLCNYGIVLTKVSRAVFEIVSTYFLVYGSYFVVSEFLENYQDCVCLFYYLCLIFLVYD